MTPVPASRRGSAVLVHGLWGNPGDWQWVSRFLKDADVSVNVPDLPSHRRSSADLGDDAAAVRDAIRSSPPPVVAVGWSYGGTVISIAAGGEAPVSHLIYVADVPKKADTHEGEDLSWAMDDPHVLVRGDGTFVLDNDWWLNEEAGTTFSTEVLAHLRQHPRRAAARGGARNDAATDLRGLGDDPDNSDHRTPGPVTDRRRPPTGSSHLRGCPAPGHRPLHHLPFTRGGEPDRHTDARGKVGVPSCRGDLMIS